MTNTTYLPTLIETSNLLQTLFVDCLVALGNEKEQILKNLPGDFPKNNTDELFTKSTNELVDKIVLNILQLIDYADENYWEIIAKYDGLLENIIKSYPSFQKSEIQEGTKRLLDNIWSKENKSNTQSSLITSVTNTLHLIYTFPS